MNHNKTLLRNKEEFDALVKSNTVNAVSILDEPDKYPCVAIWDILYLADSPDWLEGQFVYLDDFESA